MKKKVVILFLIIVLFFCPRAQNRQQVKENDAIKAAVCLIRSINRGNPIRDITLYRMTNSDGDTLLYEVSLDSFSVLLSGSKACIPVLATYKTSDVSLIEHYDSLPCNIKEFINGYISQIENCFTNDTITLFYSGDWNNMIQGEELPPARRSSVAPLITTKWNQMGCNQGDSIGYEYYTPSGQNCNHCLVGCGAVAMGQVMNYWQYPVLNYKQGMQFDWCSMSDSLNVNTPLFKQNRDAIARLLADCGDAIGSTYGCDATSSNLTSTVHSLVVFYGYNNRARYVSRGDNDTTWIELLKNQLDNGFPIIYRGNGPDGHAFVLDGYDGSGNFHINWGWAGAFDGYYSINSLSPGTSYFLYNHAAIINLFPSNSSEICNTTVYLAPFYQQYYQTNPNSSNNPYDVTPLSMIYLYSADPRSPAVYRTIPTGATATYRAHEEVVLQDGFIVERGADFTAHIVPCPNCEESRNADITDEENGSLNETVVIQSRQESIPRETVSVRSEVYPNPTDGEVTVAVDGEVQSIVIYNTTGQPVGGWNIRAITLDHIDLDLSTLPDGHYLICVQTSSGIRTHRVAVAR